MNLDIKELQNIKDKLDSLEDNVLFVDENGISKYAIMPIEMYDEVEEFIDIINDKDNRPIVKVANPKDIQLTYEEYETIKKQIMDAIDMTFKPNPEKLN